MDPTTRTFFIAGVKFRPDHRFVIDHLKDKPLNEALKIPVTLHGEPGNPYDKYAVKVLTDGTHIGYVPKPINVDIWALHEAGYKTDARLVDFDPDAPTHETFKVEVNFTKL